MKIIYITERAPFGRGESFIIPEANQLLQLGHDVRILTFAKGELFHHQMAQALVDRTNSISLASPSVLLSIACGILRRPVQTAKTAWLLRKSTSAKQLALNIVAFLKGIHGARIARDWRADHIHAHWATFTSTFGLTISALSDIPWSFTAHRYDILADNLLVEKLRHASFSRFIARDGLVQAARKAASTVMQSSCVIHMGVVVSHEIPPVTMSDAIPLFLCPAALIPRKGHRYLIDAVTLLNQRGVSLQVWLIGDGPLNAELEERIKDANAIGSIRMLGSMPNEDVLNIYRTRPVTGVVLPSIDVGDGMPEGIPVSLMEAMSFGVPAVSTCTGGTPELLGDGAGILVSPGDAAALADAMQRLIDDVDFRRCVGQLGRRRVEESFDVEVVARELASRFAAACSQ